MSTAIKSAFMACLLACGSLTVAYTQTAPGQPASPSLRERAEKGDVDAEYELAKNYEAGRGGLSQDYLQAAHWYRLAAAQGDVYAQASLGILYHSGKGVKQDDAEAYKWLYLAASHADPGAKDSIVEIEDSAASKLTPEQKAAGQKFAREFKPKSGS